MQRRWLGAVCVVVVLSGCGVDKAAESSRQADVIGNVELNTVFCTSGDVDETSHACAPFASAHRGQLLVAYRLPEGSSIPDELTDAGGVRHFHWSAGYTEYLRDTHPREGMYWAGYVSDPYSAQAGERYAFTMSTEVTLPRQVSPFVGPYRYQVVGGFRVLVASGDDGSAPVDCTDEDTTSCTSSGIAAEDSLQPTRDLAVEPGDQVPEIEPGGHVAVPFKLRLAGSGGAGVAFTLSSPDGAVSQPVAAPASDSSTPVSVDVAVPAGTEPGDYEVTLRAEATGEGDVVIYKQAARRLHVPRIERREGTMTYRVVAPKAPPPDPAPTPTPADPPPPSRPPHVKPPRHPDAPRTVAARLKLALSVFPRRAYRGSQVSYRVVARNVSRSTAFRPRVCTRLPGNMQFVRASRQVRFDGQYLCFGRRRLSRGATVAARLVAHIDVDARPGTARARALVRAANARPARARTRMRVLKRPCRPERAPVTG